MAGSGDEIAGPAGHGHLRASDADREQVIDVRQALKSRTYAEQAAVIAGLPAGLGQSRTARQQSPKDAVPGTGQRGGVTVVQSRGPSEHAGGPESCWLAWSS